LNVRIVKPVQGGVIGAIASKSAAHRLLICASLADNETFVRCQERSQDIDATARCLESLGAVIRYENDGFFVTPIKKIKDMSSEDLEKERALDCGESGSTLRFLLPVCGALGTKARFNMEGRLPARPLTGLYEEMTSHGCTLSEQGRSPLVLGGRLKNGDYSLPGNISSQFISGLLFALPLPEGDSAICVTGNLESRPYVDMTLDALRLFGINVQEEKKPALAFRVTGSQTYKSPKSVQTEGDWSNAAFWLCAGAIGTNGITCTGLDINSRQGDRAIVELLKKFGARVSVNGGDITVSPNELKGIEIDAENTPDLVPVLAAVASTARGETVIKGAGRLRLKESDRLRTVAASLSALGADVKETDDGLVIQGKNKLQGGEIQSFGDHRIAMAAAVLSGACSNPVTIQNAEAVKKSYPTFFDDFHITLGGICEKE
jgi:3-phosphoshikimate 1-carboxyvinyltransferase